LRNFQGKNFEKYFPEFFFKESETYSQKIWGYWIRKCGSVLVLGIRQNRGVARDNVTTAVGIKKSGLMLL
jgi:hypothetical protein